MLGFPTFAVLLGLILLPLPADAGAIATDQAIASATRRLQRSPQDQVALLALGSAYARKGRETNDSRYFDLAHESLLSAVKRFPEDPVARRQLAYILSLRHDFPGALEQARVALRIDGADPDAQGLLGDALLELGDYPAAQRAYDRMLTLEHSLSTLSRSSGMHSLRGDTARAIADLKRAIELGQAKGEPAESLAWAQWQLGMEYWNIGRIAQAQGAFRQSLATFPDYFRAQAGLAQVHMARGELRRAAAGFEQAMAAAPLPEYAIALAHLYTRLGQPEMAAAQHALVGRLAALSADPFNRELILYQLEHGDSNARALALQWARDSMAARQDIYAHDTLAWALYHSGQLQAARQAMQAALRLGTREAKLYFHAGMIHLALGERRQARDYLARALRLQPQFHPLHAPRARALLRELKAG